MVEEKLKQKKNAIGKDHRRELFETIMRTYVTRENGTVRWSV